MQATEEELLLVIARDRDPRAFEELVSRLERLVFSLARQITGCRELAEEVTQETLLQVWLSAPTYQPMRRPRAWIMRIAARQSIEAARGLRKSKRDRERSSLWGKVQEDPVQGAVTTLEDRELTSACRKFVDRLSRPERRLLVLYYLGDLSQEEIAHELKVSQRTVSNRLEKILEDLRAELAQAGLATCVPLLGAEQLRPVLDVAGPVPPGLHEKILAKPALCVYSGRRSEGSMVSSTLRASLAASVLIVAGLAWAVGWVGMPPPPKILAADQLGALVKSLPPDPSRPTAVRFLRTWDFETSDPPSDIRVEKGRWHWEVKGGADGSGCWETSGNDFFIAVFELPLGETPLLVSYDFCFLPPTSIANLVSDQAENIRGNGGGWAAVRMYTGAAWTEAPQIGHFRDLFGPELRLDARRLSWAVAHNYLFNGVADLWIDSRRSGLLVFETGKKSKVGLGIKGRVRIDNLKIQELAPEELPRVQEQLDALARIPASRRVGRVVLPELKSPQPDKQVTFQFSAGGAR